MKLIYNMLLLISVSLLTNHTHTGTKKVEPRTSKNYYLPKRRKYREQYVPACKHWRYKGTWGCRTYPRQEPCR